MDSLDSVITKVDDKTKVEEWIFKTDIATEDIEDWNGGSNCAKL